MTRRCAGNLGVKCLRVVRKTKIMIYSIGGIIKKKKKKKRRFEGTQSHETRRENEI